MAPVPSGPSPHRRPRLAAALALATILALAATTSALGSRPATSAEQDEAALLGGAPAACFDVTVSTADTDWLDFQSTRADGCPQADRTVIAHRVGGKLTEIRDAPIFGVCPVKAVPDEVALDLDLCVEPSEKVYLARPVSKQTTVYSVEPPKVWARNSAYYKKLKWKGWGSRTATARGRLDYYTGKHPFHADVRLTVSRIDICGTNKRTYTEITMRFVHRADHRKHKFLEGKRAYSCPIQ